MNYWGLTFIAICVIPIFIGCVIEAINERRK